VSIRRQTPADLSATHSLAVTSVIGPTSGSTTSRSLAPSLTLLALSATGPPRAAASDPERNVERRNVHLSHLHHAEREQPSCRLCAPRWIGTWRARGHRRQRCDERKLSGRHVSRPLAVVTARPGALRRTTPSPGCQFAKGGFGPLDPLARSLCAKPQRAVLPLPPSCPSRACWRVASPRLETSKLIEAVRAEFPMSDGAA